MKFKIRIVAVLLLLLGSVQLEAQTDATFTPWYAGVKVGMPIGVSTFTSFGADKTRIGVSGGVYGGYNINKLFSAEMSASFSRVGMSAHEGVSYWLGEDGNRYFAPVSGMSGYNYADIYSSVSMQNYGLKFNVDLLQLRSVTANSRWMLHASPMISAVVTSGSIKKISNDAKVLDGATNFHFGMGGELSGGYQITDELSAHIYSGVTYLAGAQFDGLPKYLRKANFVWESGIKLTWNFGKRKAKRSKSYTTPAALLIPATPIVEKEQPVVVEAVEVIKPVEAVEVIKPVEAVEVIKPVEIVEPVEEVEPKIDSVVVIKDEILTSIYFEQDQTFLPTSQHGKLNSLLGLMNSDPDLVITIIGWANTTGTVKANLRVSHTRAQNVGWWLAQRGISYNRIKMSGKGIDRSTDDLDKARRVDVTKLIKEQKNEK